MTIYLDAIWLLNFLLDMLLLMLTKALARDSTKIIRLFFGAFIASLLVPITLFFPNTFFSTVTGKLIYSVVIILCAFRFQSFYKMTSLLLFFYFSTFAVGGGLLALHFLINSPINVSSTGLLTFNTGYGDPVSWLFLMIGFPSVWLFTKKRMDKHSIEKIRYDQLCPVTIYMNGKHFSTTGYIDSGNQLVDPITKAPVVICDEFFLKKWFLETDWTLLKESYENLSFENLPDEWENFVHIIPFHGVEGKSSILLALKPEKIIVYYENQEIITNKVLIGIQFSRLTRDGQYHCLLQPQIIKLSTVHTA